MHVDLPDLLAVLGERQYAALPYRIVSVDPAVAPLDILLPVQRAIGAACEAAELRNSEDPTNTWQADPTPTALVAEINDGTMTDEEIAAFFTDLARALDAAGLEVRIEAHRPPAAIPDRDPLLTLPRPPTAFIRFGWEIFPTGPDTNPKIIIPADTLAAIAEPMADWARVPGGVTAARRGLAEYSATPCRHGRNSPALTRGTSRHRSPVSP